VSSLDDTYGKRSQLTHKSRTGCGIAFYTSPRRDEVLDAHKPLVVSWDISPSYAACIGRDQIEIQLTTEIGESLIEFKPIPFSAGTQEIDLKPEWWNNTSTIKMQAVIAGYKTIGWDDGIAVGPIFTVNWDGIPITSNSGPDSIFNAKGGVAKSGSIPKGSIAAAVLVPIFAVILAIVGYIKYKRFRNQTKLKRFSQAVDARMSRISGDWQAMSAKGANAAIRQGTATGSGMRMSRVFASEMQMDMRGGEQVSLAGRPSGDTQWSRQSRIAFHPDTNTSRERLSTYSQNRTSSYSTGRASRAFHVGMNAPPIPATPQTAYYAHDPYEDGLMSPRQANGALPLSNDDISNMDIAPALRLMRTTNNPHLKSTDDLLLTPGTPSTPYGSAPNSPRANAHFSPAAGMMPMQGQNATFMSPDDLLRQYAEARVNGTKSPTLPNAVYSPGLPPPSPSQPQYTSTGMRNLTGDPKLGRSDRL
jgi:hypothetical protein